MQHKRTAKRERERQRGPPQPKQTTNGETKEGKTKTGAGGDLGEVVNEGVRVEGDGRGQDEETLGETQTTHGFVFPQHLERRRRETRRRRPKDNQITREKRENRQRCSQGSGLEGRKNSIQESLLPGEKV